MLYDSVAWLGVLVVAGMRCVCYCGWYCVAGCGVGCVRCLFAVTF